MQFILLQSAYIGLSLCIISVLAERCTTQDVDTGKPLFLTPYIENDDITTAQQMAKVPSIADNDNIESYAGFLTVNKEYNSNLYFWFFPAEINSEEAPMIFWLEGGPGRSALYGVMEQGPYYLEKNGSLLKREDSWTKVFNIIYIENPIGTGFSFTENDKGFSRNDTEVGENLYKAILQFFQLFPKYKKNDFYIHGTSYSGKFAPALAYVIDTEQKSIKSNGIQLKGIIIGNGFCDPKTILERSDLMYQIGLIDRNFKSIYDSHIKNMTDLIDVGRYEESFDYQQNNVNEPVLKMLGYTSIHNFLEKDFEYKYGTVENFVNNTAIRKKLHVGNLTFNNDEKLMFYLRNDFFRSIKSMFEKLLETYRILMYTGQLDMITAYSTIVKFLDTLKWSGRVSFHKAERTLWHFGGELAGYTRTGGKLTDVLVRNVGHSPYYDNVAIVLDLIKDFTINKKMT